MYKKGLQQIDLKYPTVLIGICHLILLTFRIFEIAMDMYLLEELVEVHQITYILLITLLQLFIIISLFVGVFKKQHFFLLPWMCFTAPTFCMATVYATLYLGTGDDVQSIINFIFIGLFWFSWYIVFKNYLFLKNFNAHASYKAYKYSKHFKEFDNECGENF